FARLLRGAAAHARGAAAAAGVVTTAAERAADFGRRAAEVAGHAHLARVAADAADSAAERGAGAVGHVAVLPVVEDRLDVLDPGVPHGEVVASRRNLNGSRPERHRADGRTRGRAGRDHLGVRRVPAIVVVTVAPVLVQNLVAAPDGEHVELIV